jgi:hypothetical protein
MLVSHRFKFIFVKTSKTAGTSVENYLEKFCMPGGEWIKHDTPSRRPVYETESGIIGHRGGREDMSIKWYEHQTASDIRQQIGEDIWNSYTKIGTIRNPYDQAVSMFFMRKMLASRRAGTVEQERAEFEQWLVSGNCPDDKHIYCIDGNSCFDEVIRYENLYPDLNRVCDKFALPFVPTEVIKAGRKSRPVEFSSLNMYTELSKSIVQKKLKYELEFFNYSFPTTAYKCI